MKDLPAEVVIEVTGKCNFDCEGCFNRYSFADHGRNQQESNQQIKKIIQAVAEAGVKVVRFTGGEPLLRPDIFELIQFAHDLSLVVRLNTNASLIRPGHMTLLDRYIDSVLVSFNGFDAQSDERWTKRKGSYQEKMQGLALLAETKVKLRLGTVLTPYNIQNLEKIFQQVSSLNPYQWEVYREISEGKEDVLKEYLPKILDQLLSYSVRMGSLVKIANAIPFCLADREKMSLLSLGAIADDGHSRFVIDPRGHSKPSYFINVNIGRPEDIQSCWNHPFMKDMRQLKMIPERCRKCEYVLSCKGGSRYKAWVVNGSYKARDPLML